MVQDCMRCDSAPESCNQCIDGFGLDTSLQECVCECTILWFACNLSFDVFLRIVQFSIEFIMSNLKIVVIYEIVSIHI